MTTEAEVHTSRAPRTVGVLPEPTPFDRSAELAVLRAALGSGRSVMVCGELGAGKTYLVDQALGSAVAAAGAAETADDATGPRAWYAVSADLAGRSEPFGALRASLPGLVAGPGDTVGTVRHAAEQALLQATGSARPLVRVDDAHRLDLDSARVLADLARQRGIQLVVTLRDPFSTASPWYEVGKDGAAEQVDLGRHPRGVSDAWVRRTLPGPCSERVMHHLWRLAAGNTLLTKEILAEALDSRTVVQDAGTWVWLPDSPQVPVSARLTARATHELACLDAEERSVLDMVCVARRITSEQLGQLADPSLVDRLVQNGFLVRVVQTDASGRRGPVLVCPPVLSHVLVEMSTTERRRSHLLRIRAVLGSPTAANGTGLVESVETTLACGVEEDPRRIVQAVRTALLVGECETVLRIAAYALAPGGPCSLDALPGGDPLRLDVLQARAQARRFLDQPAQCIKEVRLIRQELDESRAAGTAGDSPATALARMVDLAEMLAAVEQYANGNHTAALQILAAVRHEVETALAGLPTGTLGIRLRVARMVALGSAGRFAECREEARQLLLSPDAQDAAVLPIVSIMIVDLTERGQLYAAQELVHRFAATAQAAPDTHPWAVAEIHSAGFLTMTGLGEVDVAEAIVAGLSAAGDFLTDATTTALMSGGLAMLRGRWANARADLRRANAQFSVSDGIGLSAMSLVSEALAAFACGDVADGKALLAAASQAPSRLYGAYMDAEIRLLRVEAASWSGASEALVQALELADWAADRGLFRVELDALHRAVFAAHSLGRTRRFPELLARTQVASAHVDGRRAQALAANVAAMYSGDADLLQVASRELTECGVWLPVQRPSLTLTPREQEVAALAAGGLSSKQIADRLVLSVRTVDSHLSRVFVKAGVSSRRELGAVLRTSGV